MAPEFYSGEITFKSDIYSLGVIITEILTGKKGYAEIDNVRTVVWLFLDKHCNLNKGSFAHLPLVQLLTYIVP
jgi:serine/threonine protein kinase